MFSNSYISYMHLFVLRDAGSAVFAFFSTYTFLYLSCRNVVINFSVYYFTGAHLPQMSIVLIGFDGFTRQQWLPPALKTCSHLRLWLGRVRKVVRKLLHVLGAAEMLLQASHPSMQRWNASGLMCMVLGAFHR